MATATTNRPLYVKVNEADNVAIVVNRGGLRRGTRFDSGLALTEDVPEAHKVALADITQDAPILRYGVVIGYANEPIARGRWVHEGVMRLPEPPSLDSLPIATAAPEPKPPLQGYTFEGFLNQDGSVGTKNILGITTTVQCVAATVDFAVTRIKAEILPRYPNVDDVIAITHSYGCGVAIDAPGAEIPIRTLRNLSLNPNLGGAALIVSLGCEKLQPVQLMQAGSLPIFSQAPGVVRLQDEKHLSFGDMVASIMEAAEKAARRIECEKTRHSARVGSYCGPAMRRKRCLLRSYRQPGAGIRGRSAGARGSNGDVF